MIIYVVTNSINSKVYVGQTVQSLEKRWNTHKYKGNALYNAIKKHGFENFTITQVDSAESLEELNAKEIDWIVKLNCLAPNGYNLRMGGDGGGSPSEETRVKIGLAGKGRKKTDEWKAEMSLRNSGENNPMFGVRINIGRVASKETRKKISESQLGKKKSPEAVKKGADTRRGKSIASKGVKKGRVTREDAREFHVYEKDTEAYVGTWSHQRQCAEELGVNYKSLNFVLKGGRPSHGGYKFIYADQPQLPLKTPRISST